MRVAVSGAGYVVPFHLRAWKNAGVPVAAICDPDLVRARERADAFGIPTVHASLDAMLSHGGFDLLDVASPREVHVNQALAGLDAGLPVLCQKPVGVNLPEVERLLSRLDDGGRLMVHENWRFRPHYRQIAQWIDEGRIGSLRHATITMRTCALLPDAAGTRPALMRQPFFASEKRLVVAEVLIHHLDTARRLCGDLYLMSACLRRTQAALPGETCASVFLNGRDGAPVVVTGDMTAPGAPSGAADMAEFCGSQGRIVFDGNMVVFYSSEGVSERIEFGEIDMLQASFDAAIAHFAHQTATGDPYETALADNVKTLRLVEQIYEKANFVQGCSTVPT